MLLRLWKNSVIKTNNLIYESKMNEEMNESINTLANG